MGKQKKGTKQNRFRTILKALKMELREHRSSFLVYFVLRILVIVMLVLQILNRNYENAFFVYFDVDPFDHAKSCTGDI